MEKIITSFDGTKISYSVERKGERLAVFLHGAGGDLSAWGDERKAFHEKGYSTIAIDLRGHGKSGRPSQLNDYLLEKFAEDVYAVLKAEHARGCIMIGHCFGGVITIMFHKLHHAFAKAYILIDTTYKAPPLLKKIFSMNKTLLLTLNRLLSRRAGNFAGSHVNFSKFKGTGDYDLKRIYSDITNTSLKSWLFTYQNIGRFDGTHVLKSMRKKVLVIEGEQDRIFPVDVAKNMAKLIPGAELKIIPNANHIIVINNPEELNRELLLFSENVFNSV